MNSLLVYSEKIHSTGYFLKDKKKYDILTLCAIIALYYRENEINIIRTHTR